MEKQTVIMDNAEQLKEFDEEMAKRKSLKDEIAYYKGLERREQREQMKARSRFLSKNLKYRK